MRAHACQAACRYSYSRCGRWSRTPGRITSSAWPAESESSP